mmetsp:Transcript_17925/g.60024  ORF Transcript_17925/g.60024 Transcript_17925/m.60024 type:complete len:250 (+) Transcript_17925:939-1688(+)
MRARRLEREPLEEPCGVAHAVTEVQRGCGRDRGEDEHHVHRGHRVGELRFRRRGRVGAGVRFDGGWELAGRIEGRAAGRVGVRCAASDLHRPSVGHSCGDGRRSPGRLPSDHCEEDGLGLVVGAAHRHLQEVRARLQPPVLAREGLHGHAVHVLHRAGRAESGAGDEADARRVARHQGDGVPRVSDARVAHVHRVGAQRRHDGPRASRGHLHVEHVARAVDHALLRRALEGDVVRAVRAPILRGDDEAA